MKYTECNENSSIEALKIEIERLKDLSTGYRNEDQATKILLNSCYGVIGSPVFIGYNREVAQSVTLQSQHIIQYMERMFNKYFNDLWHKDSELHGILGITTPPKHEGLVVNYLDTDSVFVVMDEVFQQSVKHGYVGDFVDFSQVIQKHRLKMYVEGCLRAYTNKFNSYDKRHDNTDSFSLVVEQACGSILWVGKKKYIKNTTWKKGARFDNFSKIEVKGLEANQSSMPKYIRGKLKELTKFLFESNGKPDYTTLVNKLIAIRQDFQVLPIEEICKTERISNYHDFILNDTTNIEIGPNCKPHTKGAALYNYLLYNDEKMKNKYQFIQTGERVKYMHIKDSSFNTEVFSFTPGSFPYEFRIIPDYDTQFEKLILGPLNNITKALNIEPLDRNLVLFPVCF